MAITSDEYLVRYHESVNLRKRPTRITPIATSRRHYQKLLQDHVNRLSAQQQLLYASSSKAILIIVQAMDAAGKDGVIKHVMSGVNPQGCQVFSFKQPSTNELQHDFLWRTIQDLPERGRIGIFNRSYYEEVLITRVHPRIIVGEGLPTVDGDDNPIWRGRYRSIVELERHLSANGTCIIKFFLHISKEEQRLRFLERIDQPDKNWKISPSDLTERNFWKDYQRAYEECLGTTSAPKSPWYIIPADDKDTARLLVSHIILDRLMSLKLAFPVSNHQRRIELKAVRRSLTRESRG